MKDWVDLMSRVPRTEKIVVGVDQMDMWEKTGVFQRVHGGKRNSEREKEHKGRASYHI